ncbi:hypothetical protein MTR67_022971 [Solanum verrucosum]|uniref:Tf2-1-like SH3-like domain-containing protein n=1 Tax=Solanum verrucosum TaxID=315347 RepID=A0AAF0TRE4_SOLVR|nr:hypothetical protein MTR67_022971 [Solanum verrucosum]
MDFVVGLPRTRRQHDSIWGIVDRLTKSAHFLPVKVSYSAEDYAMLHIKEIAKLYGAPLLIISDRDGQAERTIQTLEDMLRACVIDFKSNWDDHLPLIEFSYNNSYHSSIAMAPFEALYGRRCRSLVGWFEVGEFALLCPKIVYEATEKISPMKGVMRFGKKGKLSPRYVGPYEILKRVRKVDYELKLPIELPPVHPVFHISMLKKCIGDPVSILPLEGLGVNESLSYEEVPVAILDRQVKKLRNKEVASVKVLCRNHLVEGAIWDAEADMESRYPHHFPSTPSQS